MIQLASSNRKQEYTKHRERYLIPIYSPVLKMGSFLCSKQVENKTKTNCNLVMRDENIEIYWAPQKRRNDNKKKQITKNVKRPVLFQTKIG